ncbi:MAG: tetratricopeptide repeat protein [Deltaproteobacteria bacterium]|nr:tetratricopeptide repeat protein [Deltaproteobacteria bacterium]
MQDLVVARQNLEQLLAQLAALGLTLPPALPLGELFALLAAEGLLAPEPARELVQVYGELRFGGRGESAERFGELVRVVRGEIEGLAQEREAAASRLERAAGRLAAARGATRKDPAPLAFIGADVAERPAGLPPVFPPARSLVGPPGTAAAPPSTGAAAPLSRAAAAARTPSAASAALTRLVHRLPLPRLALLGGIALLWSLASVWLGYRLAPEIGRLRARALEIAYGEPVLTERPGHARQRQWHQQLEALRQQVRTNPGDPAGWQALAELAIRHGRHAEAIAVYRRLIAGRPDDAESLNNLAWLHCTAQDTLYRDPVQALQLAEQAHALSRQPHITDTLAEAAFQNGDIARAIALAEDALARATHNQDFYQKQLARFRQAAAREPVR